MYTWIAYLGMIIIWATTPLATQWSSEGVGFLFALSLRMTLGVVGFALYYYILNRMEVGRVTLITLITPVCALVLGNILNQEAVSPGVLFGTGFIVAGLLFYEYGSKLREYSFN